MLKKLQNLLFEEDEEEEITEEEDEEIVVQPVRRKKVESIQDKPVSPAAAVKPAPAPEPAKPVMSRVEMTQPLQVNKEEKKPASSSAFSSGSSVFKTPASVPHASPRPIQESAPAVQEPAKSAFDSLTLDSRKPESEPAKKPAKSGRAAVRTASVYEFKPVISPMFGVDEKDMEAMTVTAKATRMNASGDENVSKVISPIYGVNLDSSTTSAAPSTSEKSSRMENLAYSPAARRQEDKIPEFSLDDILSARDEEFSRTAVPAAEVRTPDVDETVVIDSEHIGKYDRKIDSAAQS